MANNPNKPKEVERKPAPKVEKKDAPIKEVPVEDPAVVHEAKKEYDNLMQRRETAANSLAQAINMSKQYEQQSFVLRGRISVFDEEITKLSKRFGFKETTQ